jgi:Fe2+ transport system protein B
MFRSVLSVVAGIAVLVVASFAIEAALNPLLLKAFPQELPTAESLSRNLWVKALTFCYGTLCVAAGGYVTAWIARRLPLRHAAAMGITQALLTIAAMFSPESNHASRLQWIVIVILTIPAAMGGGFVYSKRRNSTG